MDHFEDCCSDISVIGDKMRTITKNSDNGWSTIYGSSWIKLNETDFIKKFQIKINRLRNPSNGLMFIGISSNDRHSNGRYSFYNDNKNYSYRSDGIIYHNSKYFEMIDQGYKSNDIITFIINPFKKKISIYKNNKLINSQKYNTSSKYKYKLAVSLFNKHDSVSIINGYNIYYQETNINKNKIKHRLDVSVDIMSELMNKNDSLSTEIQLLRQELASIKQINRELQFENCSLKKQNKSLTKVLFNEKIYIKWTVDQVISWIMSIENGKYLKYYDMLNIKLNDYEINGQELKELDYVDIKQQFGIIDIDDRKLLWKNIQLLIAKNKNYTNHEGDYYTLNHNYLNDSV